MRLRMVLTIIRICNPISSMYVCICNAITDKEIRAAADQGAGALDDLSSTLGVATCCRRCADCAKCVLNDHLAAMACDAQGAD